jgi:aspartate carbamoyltransferase catalytic subunit
VIKHVVRSQMFTPEILSALFKRADEFRDILDNGGKLSLQSLLAGLNMTYMFWEPSTRTRLSFVRAAQLLGMSVEGSENAGEFSSTIKGETLEDTMGIISSYHPDVIVMRHKQDGAAERAALVSKVPIINAGDGRGQHPTQALLDVYTINRELGQLGGLTVVIGGDLKRGRTVRSLAYLLSKYPGNRIIFLSPPQLRVGQDIKDHLNEKGVAFEESGEVENSLRRAHIVYWTRVQSERREIGEEPVPQDIAEQFIIGNEQMSWMPKWTRLMHPLPRVNEIKTEVDSDPRAAYFRQAENGLYARMALLEWLVKG